MTTAVCIITQTGMKCLASPLKNHFLNAPCTNAEEDPERDKKVAQIKGSLKMAGVELSKGQRTIFVKVVELMLAADVGEDTPFTIVSVKRPSARRKR